MTPITFTVHAIPVAQPRPRAVGIRNREKVVVATRIITAEGKHPINGFKKTVVQSCQLAFRQPPLGGPLGISLVFIFPRPKSKIWKTKPMPREWVCNSKNDFDNLAKGLCDALKGILWRDDGQISDARQRRLVAAGDEAPHCEVKVWQLKPYAPEQQVLGGVV